MLGLFVLFLTALIWGGAFLAQKLGMDHVGPFAFTVYRNVLAAAFLGGALAVRAAWRRRAGAPAAPAGDPAAAWKGGWWCGLALFTAMMFQQVGIMGVSPGVCAFLTANYVLAVPLLALFLGRRPSWYVWPGVAAAVAGTYLICVTGGERMGVGRGEALSLACAALFGVQILVADHWVRRADVLKLSCVQFATGALLGLPFLLLESERALLSLANVRAGMAAIAFCGIFSSGIAYTLQNVGQRLVRASLATIVMSLESVFAALAAWLFLHETLTPRQLAGCALVFGAVVFTQVLEARK